MAGVAVDGKFASISVEDNTGTGVWKGRIGVGDTRPAGSNASDVGVVVQSRDLAGGRGRIVFLGPQDGIRNRDVFYQLWDRNVGKYPIKNAKQEYPDQFEKDQNLAVENSSTVFLSVGPWDGNNIILPSRPGELQWTNAWNKKRGVRAGEIESTNVKWGIDYGTKATLTGKNSDIVIGGHGVDFIGPGMPLASWTSIAASAGSDWRQALTLPGVDLSKAETFYVATAQADGQRVHRALAVTKQPLGANTGKKVYIGGSNGDFIWGGDNDDTLYADRFDSAETFFPADSGSRERLYASAGLTADSPVVKNNQADFTPTNYNGANQKEPGYLWWYDETPAGSGNWWEVLVYNNGYIDQLYQTTRKGEINAGTGYGSWSSAPQYDGTHQINDPVWRPGGDTVFGGRGNDVIYGDNNTNNVARLAVIKQAFNTSGKSWNYVAERGGAVRSFERDYGTLANDVIDAGEGDDVVYGGIGKDIIIGGAGKDIIYLPDAITATGYANVTGKPGTASWIMGDAGGVQRDPDLFILGPNYTTEQAMIDSAIPDGGAGSSPAQLEKQIADFNKESLNFFSFVADGSKMIPVVGGVFSMMLKYMDQKMKEYAKSQGQPVDQPPRGSDATAVITDFGPEDLIMIPVMRGERVDLEPVKDNSGMNLLAPLDARFRAKGMNNVEIDVGVNNKMYNRLVLQDFDSEVDGKVAYKFWKFQGSADYDYWFYGNINKYDAFMKAFDPTQAPGISSLA